MSKVSFYQQDNGKVITDNEAEFKSEKNPTNEFSERTFRNATATTDARKELKTPHLQPENMSRLSQGATIKSPENRQNNGLYKRKTNESATQSGKSKEVSAEENTGLTEEKSKKVSATQRTSKKVTTGIFGLDTKKPGSEIPDYGKKTDVGTKVIEGKKAKQKEDQQQNFSLGSGLITALLIVAIALSSLKSCSLGKFNIGKVKTDAFAMDFIGRDASIAYAKDLQLRIHAQSDTGLDRMTYLASKYSKYYLPGDGTMVDREMNGGYGPLYFTAKSPIMLRFIKWLVEYKNEDGIFEAFRPFTDIDDDAVYSGSKELLEAFRDAILYVVDEQDLICEFETAMQQYYCDVVYREEETFINSVFQISLTGASYALKASILSCIYELGSANRELYAGIDWNADEEEIIRTLFANAKRLDPVHGAISPDYYENVDFSLASEKVTEQMNKNAAQMHSPVGNRWEEECAEAIALYRGELSVYDTPDKQGAAIRTALYTLLPNAGESEKSYLERRLNAASSKTELYSTLDWTSHLDAMTKEEPGYKYIYSTETGINVYDMELPEHDEEASELAKQYIDYALRFLDPQSEYGPGHTHKLPYRSQFTGTVNLEAPGAYADCSIYVGWCLCKFGLLDPYYMVCPHRIKAYALGRMFTEVDINEIRTGDIICWHWKSEKEIAECGGNVNLAPMHYHVAFYLGDEKMLHTYKETHGVEVTSLWMMDNDPNHRVIYRTVRRPAP